MSGRTINEHAADLKRLSRGEMHQWTVADHDAGDRLVLERAGIRTLPAKKNVQEGIQEVARRLKPDDEGEPRIRFLRDSLVERDERLAQEQLPVCTEDEFGGYMWAKGAHGTTKDDPLKKDDYGLDALRYMVMGITTRGTSAPRLRYARAGKPGTEVHGLFIPTPQRRRHGSGGVFLL